MSLRSKPDKFFACNKSVFVMGLIALTIAAIVDLIAGLSLYAMEEDIKKIHGMMIMICCAVGMRGNIFGAMGSRIGTSMHVGTFQMTFKKNSVLRSNIEGTLTLTLLLSAIMGVIVWVISSKFFKCTMDVFEFTFISLIGGLFAGVIVMIFNVAIAREGYKRGWDVDNITAPLIAVAGDIVTIPMIHIAIVMCKGDKKPSIHVACVVLLIITAVATILTFMRGTYKGKRMGEAKRIVIQSTPVLVVCILLEAVAGAIIEDGTNLLIKQKVLLVLLPAFLNEGNALSGMLTSRLSSMLHLGTINATAIPSKEVCKNFAVMYVLALITFVIIGSTAFIFVPNALDYVLLIGTILFAGILATTVINFLSYYVAIVTIKFHLDPDDHCIPITSSIMDIVGATILMACYKILIR